MTSPPACSGTSAPTGRGSRASRRRTRQLLPGRERRGDLPGRGRPDPARSPTAPSTSRPKAPASGSPSTRTCSSSPSAGWPSPSRAPTPTPGSRSSWTPRRRRCWHSPTTRRTTPTTSRPTKDNLGLSAGDRVGLRAGQRREGPHVQRPDQRRLRHAADEGRGAAVPAGRRTHRARLLRPRHAAPDRRRGRGQVVQHRHRPGGRADARQGAVPLPEEVRDRHRAATSASAGRRPGSWPRRPPGRRSSAPTSTSARA